MSKFIVSVEDNKEKIELNTVSAQVPNFDIIQEIDKAVLKYKSTHPKEDGSYYNPFILVATPYIKNMLKIDKHNRAKVNGVWYRVF